MTNLPTEPKDILIAAAERFEQHPEIWLSFEADNVSRGATNADGEFVNPVDPGAVKLDPIGLLASVTYGNEEGAGVNLSVDTLLFGAPRYADTLLTIGDYLVPDAEAREENGEDIEDIAQELFERTMERLAPGPAEAAAFFREVAASL